MHESNVELMLDTGATGKQAPNFPMIPDAWFVAALSFSIMLVAALMVHRGLIIKAASPALGMIVCALMALAAVRYATADMATRTRARLKDFSEYCLLFMAITLIGVIASYPVAATTSGFSDAALVKVDLLLRFDWIGWYAVVAESRALQFLGMIAYSTIYLSPMLLLGYMAWTGQRGAARQFLMTFWLAAALTLLLFPLFPAKGPLAYQWSGAIPYMPITALYQSQIIPELRANLFTAIDMGALRGLVCAPSFHTVCAVLYMVAAWPIARLRWVILPINIAMLLSTPVEGNHYLADMVIGAVVAIVATLVVRGSMRMIAQARPDRAVPALAVIQPAI